MRHFPRRRFLRFTLQAGLAGSAIAVLPELAIAAPLQLSDNDWRKRLSAPQFEVLRRAATERPYSSPLNAEHRRGTFLCSGCALPLFASATKFDSGTGWPSFYDHLPRAVTATRV